MLAQWFNGSSSDYRKHLLELEENGLVTLSSDQAHLKIYEDGGSHAHAPESKMDETGAIYVFRQRQDLFREIGRGNQDGINRDVTLDELVGRFENIRA